MKKIIPLIALTGMLFQALNAQQQFIQTVTAQNKECNAHCTIIDAPGFTYDPAALIFATPVTVNGVNPYPNTIGAYYRSYQRKWSILNLNGAVMAIGAQFNLEFYPPDANHFVFIVPKKNRSTDDVYIDHIGLNNNPNAQIRVFPTNPTTGDAAFNVNEVRVTYVPSASKWIMVNKFGGDVPAGVAYNIMFTSGDPIFTNPNANKDLNGNIQTPTIPLINATNANANKDLNGKVQTPATTNSSDGNCNCIIPKSLPPDSAAGGDLGGNYPSPTVVKLYGKDLSGAAPETGQVLTWNGTQWEPKFDKNYGNLILSPYFLTFIQTSDLDMKIPDVDKALIEGLDHQSFTLSRSSDIVLYATIRGQVPTNPALYPAPQLVDAWINVGIYNSSDLLVGKASARAVIGTKEQTLVAIGGIHNLPEGSYHTSVTMNRGLSGTEIKVYSHFSNGPGDQGGELFIEVFPHNDH